MERWERPLSPQPMYRAPEVEPLPLSLHSGHVFFFLLLHVPPPLRYLAVSHFSPFWTFSPLALFWMRSHFSCCLLKLFLCNLLFSLSFLHLSLSGFLRSYPTSLPKEIRPPLLLPYTPTPSSCPVFNDPSQSAWLIQTISPSASGDIFAEYYTHGHSCTKEKNCVRMLTTCVYLQYMLYVQYRVTTVEVRLRKWRINNEAPVGGFVSEQVPSLIKVKVRQTMHISFSTVSVANSLNMTIVSDGNNDWVSAALSDSQSCTVHQQKHPIWFY